MDSGHKMLDLLQHIWPYIVGFFAALAATFRLWWSDRKETLRRMRDVEVLAKKAVTYEQLHDCRMDVAQEDHAILDEIKAIRVDMRSDNKANAESHQEIIKLSSDAHNELMRAILKLHSSED